MTRFFELAVGQEVVLAPGVTLKLLGPRAGRRVEHDRARLGVEAPPSVPVRRAEQEGWRPREKGGAA